MKSNEIINKGLESIIKEKNGKCQQRVARMVGAREKQKSRDTIIVIQ